MSRHVEMVYDDDLERWMIDLDGRYYGLHCGECFELVIGIMKIPCRLELDSQWYVMMQEVRLNLRPKDTYRVII
mgnify:CR=1 FL=1